MGQIAFHTSAAMQFAACAAHTSIFIVDIRITFLTAQTLLLVAGGTAAKQHAALHTYPAGRIEYLFLLSATDAHTAVSNVHIGINARCAPSGIARSTIAFRELLRAAQACPTNKEIPAVALGALGLPFVINAVGAVGCHITALNCHGFFFKSDVNFRWRGFWLWVNIVAISSCSPPSATCDVTHASLIETWSVAQHITRKRELFADKVPITMFTAPSCVRTAGAVFLLPCCYCLCN